MILKLASQILPLYMFVNSAFFGEDISGAQIMGWLSFYIATGPIFYFIVNGIVGSKKKVAFGIEGREIGQYAGIHVPTKVVAAMLVGISICWLLALLFSRHGI